MNADTQRIVPAPIRKTLRLRASPERAFETFVAMGGWWLKGHTLLKSRQEDVVVEPRGAGRWYEVGEDGSEQDWGRVLAWEPPHRLLLAWQLTGEWAYDPAFDTEIEVRFTPDGEHTLVEFEHRGLERYGMKAAEQHASMDQGWGMLLDLYCGAASGATEDAA